MKGIKGICHTEGSYISRYECDKEGTYKVTSMCSKEFRGKLSGYMTRAFKMCVCSTWEDCESCGKLLQNKKKLQ